MGDKPIYVTSRIKMGGLWYGKHGVDRGDFLEVPTRLDAKRLVAQGLADFGKVGLDELGRAYEVDAELALEVTREDRAKWEQELPELASRPNSGVIFTPRQRVNNGGWSV